MPQVKRSIHEALRRSLNAMPKSLQKSIRPLIPRQTKPAKQPSSSMFESPLLSVIIPVYNVRPYIEKCFESVLSQDYKNLEVIVVDDGSTDGSEEIIEKYITRHKRIRMLRLIHSGNGAARNAGIDAAHGEYLTFVDSDDVVEPGAYTAMVRQLTSSGSDFVVGAFFRQKGTKKWLPKMMSELHAVDRTGIVLDDFPEILRDVFLWNKVFRRDFWEKSVGDIPEGVLYEDQETIARAFLRARSFDVLQVPVYTWRIREDNSSITQQKGDISDLIDRMRAALIVTNLVASEGSAEVNEAWFVKSLGEDLRLYIEQVPQTGDDYWEVLQSAVSRLYVMAGSNVPELLPIVDRVLVYLISHNHRQDLEDVLVSLRDNGRTFPVRFSEGTLYAIPFYARNLASSLPPHILQFNSVDVELKTRLLDISWRNANTVVIRAAAYLSGVDATVFAYKTKLELKSTTTGDRIAVAATLCSDQWIDQVSGDPWNSYEHSVFEAVVDVGEFLGADGKMTANGHEWILEAAVEAAGITRKDVIRIRDGAKLPFQLATGNVINRSRVVAQIDRNRGLRFRVIRYTSMASGVSVQGRTVSFEFRGVPNEIPNRLFLKSGEDELTAIRTELSDGCVFSFVLPVPKTSFREVVWDVYSCYAGGSPHFVGWPSASTDRSGLPAMDGALSVRTTGYGYLRLALSAWRVSASECTVDQERGTIVVTGRSAYLKPGNEMMLDLILATNRSSISPLQVSFTPGTEIYTAVFPLFAQKWGRSDLTQETGHYKLYVRTIDENGTVRRHSVKATGHLAASVPVEDLTDRSRIILSAEDRERSFVVKVLAPYKPEERGPFAQQQLREKYLANMLPIDMEMVLFESFAGKSATDSVRAISDEMGRLLPKLQRYWTIADYSVPVPEGCTGVLIYSSEWYQVLNTSGTLVNNNNFPHYFRKRMGQFYVQTWHGTPLKKIGNHTPIANLSASYRRLMKREATYWDLLLAQNTFAGHTLPEAFGYCGTTLTTGYPRNDSMLEKQAPDRRSRIRNTLGIMDGAFVILYTPTWRDNIRTSQNKFDVVDFLNFEEINDVFGSDVTVMSRGHHNVAAQRRTAERSTYIDVTTFPEIADLYLAADLMITDYSSSMFDFCVTKKPIIFLAPDIDEYQNQTRGFYFDFQSEAPGPIVSTTAEVIDLMKSLELMAEEYKEKYSAFVKRYAELDDGFAAKRVLDAFPIVRSL